LSASEICDSQNCLFLKDFSNYIYTLKFEEKPNYSFLRWLLIKNLLAREIVPRNQFDWVKKIREGQYQRIKDMTINFNGNQDKKQRIKLSNMIKDQIKSMYLLKEFDINHILLDNHKDDVISQESIEYGQSDLDEHPS